MDEAKSERLTLRALQKVQAGDTPADAWLETLKEHYPVEMLANQVKHSCPKWAFCILCHYGHVRGVKSGCCPKAEESSSAAYTLKALDVLRSDPSLARDKKELKRMVFGSPNTPEYRTPNDEVEVLLALWEADAIELQGNV